MATRLVDDRSDLVDALNLIHWRDKSGDAQYGDTIIWRLNDAGNYILDADNAGGLHANFGSGKLLVTDALVTVGTAFKATGAADFDSTLNADGAVTFGSTLGVTGLTTLAALTATGNVQIGDADADAHTFIGSSTFRDAASTAFPLYVNLAADQVQLGSTTALTGTTAASKFEVIGGRAYFAGSGEQFALAVRYSPTSGNYFMGATNSANSSAIFSDASGVQTVAFGHSADTYQCVVTGTADITQKLFVGNALSNSHMTQGITIGQSGNDDHILAGMSTDVAHGMTDFATTETYFCVIKNEGAAGGIKIRGFTETTVGASIQGFGTTDNTTVSTAATGCVEIAAHKKSGTSVTFPGAGAIILAVKSLGDARVLFDQEGDIRYDGASAPTAYDDHDDVALLEAFRLTTAPGIEVNYRERFCQDVAAHARTLHETGVITLNDDGHHFISTKGLNGLIMDSIRQVYGRVLALETQIRALEAGTA